MPAKITITGKRVDEIIETKDYYRFDMMEQGSPTAPKGLPVASKVHFTVFVSKKAGRKANILDATIETKWMVQGEIILDLPMNECPGEIGVIGFQIVQLPSEEEKERLRHESLAHQTDEAARAEKQVVEGIDESSEPCDRNSSPSALNKSIDADHMKKQSNEQVFAEVAATKTVELATTDAHSPKVLSVSITELEVDPAWRQVRPNPTKSAPILEYMQMHGKQDKPIEVRRNQEGKYVLADGYRRLYLAEQLGWEKVEIVVVQ